MEARNTTRVKRCDKTSVDPAKHAGPFESVDAGHHREKGERIRVERCKACGKVVLRERPPESDQSEGGERE